MVLPRDGTWLRVVPRHFGGLTVRLENYGVGYRGRTLFSDVNIEFGPGINHLLGSNGTGKSTLAKSLAGLIPHKGTVDCNPDDVVLIGSYSALPSDLRVCDLLKYERGCVPDGAFNGLCCRLGVSEIPKRNRIGKLSDGQRQKLKLLHFLLPEPRVVVLDECTAALDKKSADSVRTFICDYAKSRVVTIINITHDVSDLTRMPGKNYVLSDGEIIEYGSVAEAVQEYIGGPYAIGA